MKANIYAKDIEISVFYCQVWVNLKDLHPCYKILRRTFWKERAFHYRSGVEKEPSGIHVF